MPARERLDRRAGWATAPRSGPWPAPGPGPLVRYRLSGSPPAGRFWPAASLAPGGWPRHRSRPAAAPPPRGASSDGGSRAAARSRKPASRLTGPGGLATQTEHLISGRSSRKEASPQEQKRRTPPGTAGPFPRQAEEPYAKKTNPDSQKRRALPPPAGEHHVPPSRGELYPAEWRRAKPGRRQTPYPRMRGGPDLRQAGKEHTPARKVASRPQWAGDHLRLPRSGLRRWPVQPTPLAGIKESGRAGSPPSCRP